LTPADKEITIYISFHIIHLVFELVQYLVERLFTIQVAHDSGTRIVSQQFDTVPTYLADISRSDKPDFKSVIFFLFKK